VIGLDTNILVRYFIQDDKTEGQTANEVIEKQCSKENPGFIHDVVLCELVWVLDSRYQCPKDVISTILEKILTTAQFQVAHRNYVWEALQIFRKSKADFSDCLIGVKNSFSGCRRTLSFDKGLKDTNHFSVI
jgi:predicted nucleic-acid-binding protein